MSMVNEIFVKSTLFALIIRHGSVQAAIKQEFDYIRTVNTDHFVGNSYFRSHTHRVWSLMQFLEEADLDYSMVWRIEGANLIEVRFVFSETTQLMIILNFGQDAYNINHYIAGSATDIGKIAF